MKKKTNISLEDKIRLAQTKPIYDVNKVSDKGPHSIISRWIREFKVDVGTHMNTSKDCYAEFTEWCLQNGVKGVPSLYNFGSIIKQIVVYKRRSFGVVYYMNKTIEEIKQLRESSNGKKT